MNRASGEHRRNHLEEFRQRQRDTVNQLSVMFWRSFRQMPIQVMPFDQILTGKRRATADEPMPAPEGATVYVSHDVGWI